MEWQSLQWVLQHSRENDLSSQQKKNGKNLINLNQESLVYAILQSCKIKSKIVSKDENLIFYKLKDLKDVGNVITNAETPFNVLYISNKPPLMLKTIDYLPYHPY